MKYAALGFLFLCSHASMRAESLHYTINWPSGLNLGEATLRSDRSHDDANSAGPWEFELDVDASVPGFAVRDHYRSTASADFCSVQLEKDVAHGSRKSAERVTFDQGKRQVTRETLPGGGKTQISVPACARDPLSFLQFVRRELAQGRLAPRQPLVFGAIYEVRLEYAGTRQVPVGSDRIEADLIQTTFKGPASQLTFELYFSRDAARKPLFAKLPLPLGAFTVELLP
jgi:hypothetical protein